ncbi:MAG: glycosyltransferase family 2 protein [Lautropia sp.]
MRHAFAIPAYGESPYLHECIASLRAQTSGSSIVLCTSTPNAHIAAAARLHGIALKINPHRGGIASDWNFALEAPAADLVTVAHQDDVYAPGYGDAVVSAIRANPDASIAFTDHAEYGPHGPRPANLNVRIKRALVRRAFGASTVLRDVASRKRLLRLGNPISCPSVTFNRRAIPDFRFSDAFTVNLDWDAWDRLAEGPGAFALVRQPLVAHRVHPGTETSASIVDRRRLDEDRRMFRRFWPGPAAHIVLAMYRLSYHGNRT